MEASENTAGSQRSGGPALHRVDPDRVAASLSAERNADGLARLSLMVNTVFERLVSEPHQHRG